MGCTSSKSARRNIHRNIPARLRNSRSMPPNHHITLKSCTLGSLKLDRDVVSDEEAMKKASNDYVKQSKSPEMKPMTPCNEPEIINAWELMEGLEDVTPLRPPSAATLDRRSMSFSVAGSSPGSSSRFINHRDSSFSEFDPEVVSTFRKTLVELSPQHRQLLRSPEPEKMASRVLRSRYMDDESCRKTPDLTGIVRARIEEFQERINSRKVLKVQQSFKSWLGMGGEGRVVVYLTSLRGIRQTYNECKEVREILRSYRVRVDERDVSMHRGFKEELNEMLGFEYGGRRLPAVFVKGEYLGGMEEVRRLHEGGELGKVVEGCELMMAGKNGGGGGECEECGEVRFVLCGRCSGSCKVFVQEDHPEEDSGDGGSGGGFWCRCSDCNENGIVRCPICC
ncbi:hypothetical protein J5N97_005759 [Dioscorea zingiberensis]|uniref:Glutaredoxin domain-containing protein n=1 Tax=Dioscorea zingiberensis TaxID=325984 RepID=A0A9D5D8Y5_9LILI|nr:hypothetical protein J5N97_005759 [Dioscorea zingiberensis]